MSQYSKLALSIEADSTWTSKIIVDIPTPLSLLNVYNSGLSKPSFELLKVDKNTKDIIPLLNPLSIVMKCVLKSILNYPKGTSFHVQGYQGVDNEERLKVYLIDKVSSSDSTQLVVGIADRLKIKTTLKFYTDV